MRIAYVIINANRSEGTSRAVLEVAERVARDHEVELWARAVKDADLSRIRWRTVPGPARPEVADFQSFKTFVDLSLRHQSYDIVHSAGPNTRQANVYTIQTVHPVKMAHVAAARAADSAGWLRRFAWWAYDRSVVRAERQSFQGSHAGRRAFLPVSDGTRQELLLQYPDCQQQMVATIPNGADLERFSPCHRTVARQSLEQEFQFASTDIIVLFSGGDWRRKGLDLALRALAKIDYRHIRLLVAGHDRAGADVAAMVGELGLQDRVTFAGFRTDVERFYAGSDLFLFPTVYEAFSLATIEAAASGLPVLMSNVSGAHELVGSGEAGELIPRDPDGIANIILRYALHPELRAKTGRQAREHVERHFSWDAITGQTLSVYQKLLNHS